MAARISWDFGRERESRMLNIGISALLLILLSLSQGSRSEENTLPISSHENRQDDISIRISESIRDTRTASDGHSSADAILSTEMVSNSSYINPERLKKSKRHLHDGNGLDNHLDTTEEFRFQERKPMTSREYYPSIKPTKTVSTSTKEEIAATLSASGEANGVSTDASGPRTKSYDKKYGKKGKMSFYREGRDEEENRKANPDIQDIITGIVKILNGKTQDGRPIRPTSNRINNRGPPRISDVPPLDFDPPVPTFAPTRIPPPYPFDVPPPMPNVPLPPQPSKPGSNLPSHPFIDGVPLPEKIVPSYDTISMSEQSGDKMPSITKNETNVKFSSMNNAPPQNVALTPTDAAQNVTKTDLNKPKPVKTQHKRPRPRPTMRPRPNNGTKLAPTKVEKNETRVTTQPTTPGVKANATEPPIKHNVTLETASRPTTATATTPASVTDKLTTLIQSVLHNVLSTTEASKPKLNESRLPVLLEPSVGVGEATPILESSVPEILTSSSEVIRTTALSSTKTTLSTKPPASATESEYKARPGIVLDDPEYKPGVHKRPVVTNRPIITAAPAQGHYGEIFDVTVHAVQGPGGEVSSGKPYIYPVEIEGVQVHGQGQGQPGDVSVITKPQEGQKFVSIDGKRTYINLFGESTSKISATATHPPIVGTGFAVPHKDAPVHHSSSRPASSTQPPRRPYKRPNHPPVRIDTCIVGDDSTCDAAQNEECRTEDGVSSCHCRPGYNRRKHRDPCRRVVSMLTSLRVDRLYDRKVTWQDNLQDPDSDEYQQLSYEASQAMESAMSMTPFSDDFINSRINSIYTSKNLETNQPAVYVNMTIQLEENLDTLRPAVKHDIQRHLIRVIQRRNNNVGNSALWVDSPPGSVLALQDVDECSSADLHDCHEQAACSNTFGSFKCQCPAGSRDPWVGNIHRQGRFCETCPSEYCNNRGECKYEHGQQVCYCAGSFYGAQCEVDGEVLGVAIGASVAAAIIIILTLVCLCMWSRRWSREHKSAVGSPVFGYMATGPTVKTPSIGAPPYQVSLEDRIRWAQIADVMAQANHYAQPEPGNNLSRTTFGGYPTLPHHTLSVTGTLPLPGITPPVPLPRLSLPSKGPMSTYGGHSQHGSIHQSTHGMRTSLDTTSSSEEEDRADLLGRNFNAPRPKSRASVANQSGIYYDVDFERSEMYAKQNNIPMSTYTLNPQHQMRPYFR